MENDEYIGDEPDYVEIHLIEVLSDLEHEQWEHWSKSLGELLKKVQQHLKKKEISYAYDLIQDKLNKWEINHIPYSKLTEDVKEYDRVWARKVLPILKRFNR